MINNKISGLLILSFLLLNFQIAFAQTNDWESVKSIVNSEIAVKKNNGKTVFGRLTSANDDQIEVQIATKKDVSTNSTTITKSEIKKIWQAKLRFGKRNTLKGALIGAGVGAAVGTGLYAGLPRNEHTDGLEVLAIPMAMGIATGVGTLVGYFSKKSHKKGKLIYRV